MDHGVPYHLHHSHEHLHDQPWLRLVSMSCALVTTLLLPSSEQLLMSARFCMLLANLHLESICLLCMQIAAFQQGDQMS